MHLSPGYLLNNRYRIVRLLGQGGFGAVYRAWDILLNRPCAVKEHFEFDPEAERQFAREAQMLARLAHPNLSRVLDYFSISGQGLYLVMDFVEGEELESIVHRQGKLSSAKAIPWITQVGGALSYLHTQNPPIVHRDVKPANIRIRPDGVAMLVDFGLAKSFEPHYQATSLGARAVTPGYSPLEQYGMGSVDARTDIYALSATLYYLLTGKEPPDSIARMSGTTQLASPRQIDASIPPEIEAAIMKAMEVNREKRYSSINDFILELLQGSQAVPAPAAQGTIAAPSISDMVVCPRCQHPQDQRAIFCENCAFDLRVVQHAPLVGTETTMSPPAAEFVPYPMQPPALSSVIVTPSTPSYPQLVDKTTAELRRQAIRPSSATPAWVILLAVIAGVAILTGVGFIVSSNFLGTPPISPPDSSIQPVNYFPIFIPLAVLIFGSVAGFLVFRAISASHQRQQADQIQSSALISQYQAASALEKLALLLAPIEGLFQSSQVEGELRKLQVVFDHQQLEDALLALSRRKLLDKEGQAWRVSQARLAQQLRQQADPQGLSKLAGQVRDEYPLYKEIQQFLKDVGFQLKPVDPFGFLCTSDKPLWRDVTPIYTRLVVERQLDMDEFQDLLKSAREALKTSHLDKRYAMVVINQPPSAGDLYQVFALHHQEGFTVIPLPRSLITQARLDERESQALREQVDLYTGKADLYDVHTAVSDVLSFFGRAAQLAEMKRLLTAGHSVMVFGMRKAGKSSLLARLREELAWPVASLDMEGFNQNPGNVFDEALRAWKSAIRVVYPEISLPRTEPLTRATTTPDRAQAFRRTVARILELLYGQPGQPGLLLFLDEMDLLLSQPDYVVFAGALRSMTQDAHWRGRFALLLAGLEPTINRLDHLGAEHNPFYSFFIEKPISMLESEDTCHMVVSIGGQMGVAFNDQARDLLVEAGGGHPFITRQLCSRAVRELERPATVNVDCATRAIDSYFKDPYNYFAQSLWALETGGPPGADAYLLRCLAETQPLAEQALIPPEYPAEGRLRVEMSLAHLRDQSLIRQQEDGWEYTIPLFRHWVRRNILKLPEGDRL